jgi:Ni/Co efflux regulator RcnB
MISIRLIAAAVLASSGLALSTPALSAPKADTAAAPWANQVVLVKEQRRDRNLSNRGANKQWRSRDGQRDAGRRGDRAGRNDRQRNNDGDRTRTRRSDRDWRRDGDRTRHSDRDRRRYGDRGHTRHSGRDWRRDGRHDNGNHYGWQRGKHYGWNKGKKYRRWRARHHPRHGHYVGRYLPRRTRYVVIRDYDDYYLPPPRRGHYYARVDNDVYLVAEATKLVIDAFVLLDAASR